MSDDGKTYTLSPAQGHEVVGRRAVHRRRFHVLVRGHLLATRRSCRRRSPDMRPQGKPGRMVKVDETTVAVRSSTMPYFLFEDIMAGDTLIGGGQSVRQAPEGHLRRLRARRTTSSSSCRSTPRSRRGQRARQAGGLRELGAACCTSRRTGRSTPSCRCSGPGARVRPINTPIWLLERNPYYYAVDTAGNQLPYIDQVAVHAGREPRGHQPARDGRRIRRAGAPHRPRQAAGDPREPGEGQLHGPSRSRASTAPTSCSTINQSYHGRSGNRASG